MTGGPRVGTCRCIHEPAGNSSEAHHHSDHSLDPIADQSRSLGRPRGGIRSPPSAPADQVSHIRLRRESTAAAARQCGTFHHRPSRRRHLGRAVGVALGRRELALRALRAQMSASEQRQHKMSREQHQHQHPPTRCAVPCGPAPTRWWLARARQSPSARPTIPEKHRESGAS